MSQRVRPVRAALLLALILIPAALWRAGLAAWVGRDHPIPRRLHHRARSARVRAAGISSCSQATEARRSPPRLAEAARRGRRASCEAPPFFTFCAPA
jgi:hypothetical protein